MKAEKSMKFVAKRRCHGFRNRLWREGDVVDVYEHELNSVPKHFEPIHTVPVKVQNPLDPVAISHLRKSQKPRCGLAYGTENAELDVKTLKPKRGRPKKVDDGQL